MNTTTGQGISGTEAVGVASASYSAILKAHETLIGLTNGKDSQYPFLVRSVAHELRLMLTSFKDDGLVAVVSDTHPDPSARLAEILADVRRALPLIEGNGHYGNGFMLTIPVANNGEYVSKGARWGTLDGVFE